jgi:hypothetical protein
VATTGLSVGDLPPTTSTSAATTSGADSTSAATSGVATSGAATSEVTTAGTFLNDVGSDKDLGGGKPVGCQGKIDFLFVISRHATMADIQDKLIAAFPAFIDTIEAKFEDFDFHIMVVDGDDSWGNDHCNKVCTLDGCVSDSPALDNYPCHLLDLVTPCDSQIGAGVVFPAGAYASNVPCKIAEGRRYMTRDQPNLKETFTCVAKLGVSGLGLMGEALAASMLESMNGPGGCNEGFLRDDALLMVTFIGNYDYHSKGTPGSWAASVLKAKGGSPEAAVMFSILDPECPPEDRVCELVEMFPYHLVIDGLLEDFAVGFDEATSLVDDACAEFIPQ